jgi:thiosulfate dehydrogenase [quinone] large subunit
MDLASIKTKQINGLILMRLLIGWHFLYEGIIKMYNPQWTAKAYLMSADGLFKGFFTSISGESMIGIIDFLNIAALIIVGISLLIGYAEKLGAWIGILLLLMYYLAHPAFPGIEQLNVEGNYWIVNKNLIEAAALYVLSTVPTGQYFGIGRLFQKSTLQTN